MEVNIHQIIRLNGYRLQFKNKENQSRFLEAFKESDFGPRSELPIRDEKRKMPQKPTSTTTFTCVIRDFPTEVEMKELMDTLKQSYP